jgi:hypothetical protein
MIGLLCRALQDWRERALFFFYQLGEVKLFRVSVEKSSRS